MNIDKSKIVIYNINTSPGVMVIINHLKETFNKRGIFLKEVTNCDDPSLVYIPYGPKCAYLCAKRKRQVLVDLMVDYYGYGSKNRFLDLLKKGYWNNSMTWLNCATWLLYYYREYVTLKQPYPHMLVSKNDIKLLKRRFPKTDFIHVANGCELPKQIISKTNSEKIRLAVLSNWTFGTLADVQWFIDDYLPKIKEVYPRISTFVNDISAYT